MKRIFMAMLAAVLFAGCATTPKINWQARVGNYTYDQAVRESGPPDKSAKLSDGTTVATWITERSQTFVTTGPYFVPTRHFYGPVIMPGYSETYFPARYLQLTFGADGKLASEKEFAK
jgi:hypothetical protein